MDATTIKAEYRTGSGNVYPLELGYFLLPKIRVPVDRAVTTAACIDGCGLYGRNGGCPPYAPDFSLARGDWLLVLYAKLRTEYYPKKVLEGPYYTRWVFVETFLTSLTNRLGKSIASRLSGFFLSSGNCHGCRPKRCAFKDGAITCRNPEKRTYSLEACGVLVADVIKKYAGQELQWWNKDIHGHIPEYMIKIVGVSVEVDSVGQIEEAVQQAIAKDRLTVMP